MKKIIYAMLAGALISGVAFASDISFSYTSEDDFATKGSTFSQDGHYNDLCLTLSNDTAGASFEVDSSSSTATPTLETYYGWMNFALPMGSLQVETGRWTERYVNRVKTDAGLLDSGANSYYELYKPGVINGTYAADADNLTKNLNSGSLDTAGISTAVAYTLKDLPGTLMVKGLIANSSSNYWNGESATSDDDTFVMSSFAGEIAYKQDNLVNVNFAVRSLTHNKTSFGVFVSPLMMEKLNAMVGFSYGKDADNGEYGIDLRARYEINDKLAVTTMNNYSVADTSVDINGDKGLKSMWNMLSVSYKGGDNIRFIGTADYVIKDFAASFGNTTDADHCNTVAFTPAFEINATKSVTINTGFTCTWINVGNNNESMATSIPFIFSFAL